MKIDINCDLGEGTGNDAALMPLISSCNIACGGHTGDVQSMHDTLLLAKKHRVKVGAHPSFPDSENFGRKVLKISTSALTDSLIHQILSLKEQADKLNLLLNHIKPHGALYNLAAKDRATAQAVIAALKKINLPVALYAPYKSVLAALATQEKIPVVYEAFMDRRYNADLSLVSRQQKGAVLSVPQDVFDQLYSIVMHGEVKSISGKEIGIKADTFCIHGDNVQAVAILTYVHRKLKSHNLSIV